MKTVGRLILAAIFLAVTGIVVLIGKSSPELFTAWYPAVSQWLLGAIGSVTSSVPLPLWELALVPLALWLLYSLVRAIQKRRLLRWLAGVALCLSIYLCAFVVLWGAGHFALTKTEQIYTPKKATVSQLEAAAAYYARQLEQAAPLLERDERGHVLLQDFDGLSAAAAEAYKKVSSRYPVVPRAELRAKKLLVGDAFGYMGITGIFVPITAEAAVSPHTYASSLPFTICHELGHRLGACAEEDANFLAFLACVESDDVQLNYSGWYSAFVYCYNALYEASPGKAEKLWHSLTPLAQADLTAANTHYEPYEGPVQEVADKLNDAYLQAAGQEAGVKSYGLVSDALIAWYEENAKK